MALVDHPLSRREKIQGSHEVVEVPRPKVHVETPMFLLQLMALRV